VFSFETHRDLDYIFAILMFPLTTLYFVHWGDTWAPLERLLIIVFALIISVLVISEQDKSSMVGQAIIAAASLAIPIIYWIGYAANAAMQYPRPPLKCCCQKGYESLPGGRYFPKYEWGALLAGVSLTSIAIYLFTVQGTLVYSWTWVLHSMWHILAAFGQYYIIQIKAPAPLAAYRVLDADINKITPEIVKILHDKHGQFDKRYPIQIEVARSA
jgi:hypothetical protein